MNNRLTRAGPGIRRGESRRIGRPAATPGDHPELHSETAFSNGNAGCTSAQTAVETSRHSCGLPQIGSREQLDRSVPRLGRSRTFPLAWAWAFSAPVPWSNAWTAAEGLRVRAVVVGAADGGARRPWTETILSGGGSVSPYGRDPGDDAGPDGAAGARVLAYRPPDCSGALAEVASTVSGDQKERALRSLEEQRRREDDVANAGRRITDSCPKLPETRPGLDFAGKRTTLAAFGVQVLATPVELPVIASVDPDVTAIEQTWEVMSNVSTAHTGRVALGPPGPGRTIGRA